MESNHSKFYKKSFSTFIINDQPSPPAIRWLVIGGIGEL